MVMAGARDYCYRYIAPSLPRFKLLFWHISSKIAEKGIQAESLVSTPLQRLTMTEKKT